MLNYFYQSYGPLAIFNSKFPLQLLLQFSVDFNEIFQLLLPWLQEDHIIRRSRLIAFYQNNAF